MRKRYSIVLVLVLAIGAGFSCSKGGAAETTIKPVVQVGQSYKVLVGMAAIQFKVLEAGERNLVKVQAVESASGIGIDEGTIWWLNLDQVILVEAK